MGFLDIGAGEILLILIVALIIWGPGKIPEIARTLGKITRGLKKATFDLTAEVTREMDQGKKGSPTQTKASDSSKNSQTTSGQTAGKG